MQKKHPTLDLTIYNSKLLLLCVFIVSMSLSSPALLLVWCPTRRDFVPSYFAFSPNFVPGISFICGFPVCSALFVYNCIVSLNYFSVCFLSSSINIITVLTILQYNKQ